MAYGRSKHWKMIQKRRERKWVWWGTFLLVEISLAVFILRGRFFSFPFSICLSLPFLYLDETFHDSSLSLPVAFFFAISSYCSSNVVLSPFFTSLSLFLCLHIDCLVLFWYIFVVHSQHLSFSSPLLLPSNIQSHYLGTGVAFGPGVCIFASDSLSLMKNIISDIKINNIIFYY